MSQEDLAPSPCQEDLTPNETIHNIIVIESLRGSKTFKLAFLVISIVIDCDRGHCYEHFKKKSNSDKN